MSKNLFLISYKYSVHVETKETVVGNEINDKTEQDLFVSHVNYTMQGIGDMELGRNTKGKLSYSGQRCYRIPEALGKLYGLKVHCLDLSYNELVTLKGLEAFPHLEELILDNNQLTDSVIFPPITSLHTLSLNKNLISDLEALVVKIAENFPNITYFSLLGNQACPNQLTNLENDEADYQRYRYFVLYHLPNLKFLDSTKVCEEERIEAKRRGQFMKIVRPKVNNLEPDIRQDMTSNYSPLPSTIRKFNEHKGAYGKCRYKYSGKHSEGNRFICNKDL